jgi:hypothetical protein
MFDLSSYRRRQRMLDCESCCALEGDVGLAEGTNPILRNFKSFSQKNRKEIERSSFQKLS